MDKPKIFITGCAKTGTTLLRRLFNAFDLNVYNEAEIPLVAFIDTEFDVAKRTKWHIFTLDITPQMVVDQLKLIRDNNIKVVNIVREKKATMASSDGYIPENRYDACMKHVADHIDDIAYLVGYERLIQDPDVVQQELALELNLDIIHNFSDYPKFITWDEPIHGDAYSLRKIGEPINNKNHE